MALIAKLLGKDLTKWARLKTATGVTSDEDLLHKLIHFFAEAKGISLTEPQLPLPWATAAVTDGPTVEVQVTRTAEDTLPSSFIVIHQEDLVSDGDTFPVETVLDDPDQTQLESRNSLPMMMLREDEDSKDDGDDDPGDADYIPEMDDMPVGKAKRVYFRERMLPPANPRCTLYQDRHTRALNGVLWRDAVFRGLPMPLDDIRILWTATSRWWVRVRPTPIPWPDPPPVQEFPSEMPLLKHFGCTLCDRMGFQSRVEVITHFWLQHPETRERYPTHLLASKRDPTFAHCALCMEAGCVAPSAKHNRLEPHVASAHVACQRASERAPHVCDVCHVELASEAARDQHVALEHPEYEGKQYVCPVCEQVETGEQAYIRHLRIHYTEFVYACNVCPNFRSREPETMTSHTACHERRTFRCGLCPLITRTFRTLVDHISIHLELPRHICPVCGYKAYTSSRYFSHMDKHGGRRHKCEICAEEFTSSLKKSHHKTIVHRRPPEFTCEKCDITFKSTSRLRRHQASHTGHKPFSCDLCGKGLSSKQSLRNHARICRESDELYRHGAVVEMMIS